MTRLSPQRERDVTIKEVARLAGVAPSSASRALNGQSNVSGELRARVMRAADQLGYHPDLLAQSLRRGATRIVGFIVRDISNPLFAGIVKGAEQVLETEGYSVLLTSSLRDPHLEAKHIDVLCQRRVDGLILSLQSETSAETFAALRNVRVPMVLLDREIHAIAADSVLFDHAAGVHEATTDLLNLGHRRIGLLLGAAETRASRERLRGYLNAFEDSGLHARREDVLHVETMSSESAGQLTRQLVEQSQPPTAIIAGDSQLGVGMLLALRERGLRHGHDVSVVVCDDLDLFQLTDPPVSVVRRGPDDMGTLAAQMLVRRLNDPAAGQTSEMLATTYVRRGSTQAPRKARNRRPRASAGR